MTRIHFAIPLPPAHAKRKISDRGFQPECISTKAGVCVRVPCGISVEMVKFCASNSSIWSRLHSNPEPVLPDIVRRMNVDTTRMGTNVLPVLY